LFLQRRIFDLATLDLLISSQRLEGPSIGNVMAFAHLQCSALAESQAQLQLSTVALILTIQSS